MDSSDTVKKEYCDQNEDNKGIFVKSELEPEVLIKTEVTDEDFFPINEIKTVFNDQSQGSFLN